MNLVLPIYIPVHENPIFMGAQKKGSMGFLRALDERKTEYVCFHFFKRNDQHCNVTIWCHRSLFLPLSPCCPNLFPLHRHQWRRWPIRETATVKITPRWRSGDWQNCDMLALEMNAWLKGRKENAQRKRLGKLRWILQGAVGLHRMIFNKR